MEELASLLVQALSLMLLAPLVDGLRVSVGYLGAGLPPPPVLAPIAHLAKLLEKEDIEERTLGPRPRLVALGALAATLVAGLALPIIVPLSVVGALGLPAFLGGLWASLFLSRLGGSPAGTGPGIVAGIALVLLARAQVLGTTHLGTLLAAPAGPLGWVAAIPLLVAAAADAPGRGGLTLAPRLGGPSLACMALAASVRRLLLVVLAASHVALGLGHLHRLLMGLLVVWVACGLGVLDAVGPRPSAQSRSGAVVMWGAACAFLLVRA